MKKIVLFATILAITEPKSVPIQKRSSVCYSGLGCFSTDPPFFSLYRPLNFLPQSPGHINTQFNLFTRLNPTTRQLLLAGDRSSVTSSNFDFHKPTKMICHGFLERGSASWLGKMKDEFLKSHDYNVIVVGWGGGSLPPYTQATANTRVVGAQIAQLIKFLQAQTGSKPEDFHIIGHSLGAHIAGYAGERIQYVGRITGLDPAEPYFQNTDIKVRLDPTDALFVDVIHTDGQSILKLGYGMKQPCGHVDYFPNGGMSQPGCDKDPITQMQIEGIYDGVKEFVACNHLRAHHLFTETINSVCPFEGYKCNSYDDFNNGKCMPCSGKACGYMGFHADRVKPPSGQSLVKYFLKTDGDAPYCRYHYQVQITFGNPSGARSERGDLFATIIGEKGQTGEIPLTEDSIDVAPGTSYAFIMLSRQDLGQVSRFHFRWHHNSALTNPFSWNILNLRNPKLYLSKVVVVNGEASRQFTFCGNNVVAQNNHMQAMTVQGSC